MEKYWGTSPHVSQLVFTCPRQPIIGESHYVYGPVLSTHKFQM